MRAPLLLALLLIAPAMAGCFADPTVRARDYVSGSDYTTWIIEIDYVSGHAPSSTAVNLLKTRMAALVDKDTITVTTSAELPAQNKDYSLQDLLDLKAQHQDAKTGGKQVVTWVAYLDGAWHQEDVLGVTLSDHETVGMFHASIQDAAGGLFSPYSTTDIERPVLVHEFGHVIGLVDNGLPMQSPHEDSEHQGHSDNPNSVMYWAVETANIVQAFSGGPPTTFDADDRADVCAAGGKC